MARKGKEFEELIAKLEKMFLPTDAIITSPDFIIDKITGEKREVDISIKHKYGTSEYLTIIECRDRNSVQDSTWIEQLASKSKDIGANKTIVVSTGGFTQPSITKANAYGIETRVFEELNDEIIESWFPSYITFTNNFFNLKEVNIIFEEPGQKLEIVQLNTDDKVFISNTTKIAYSINEVVKGFIDSNPSVWEDVLVDGPKKIQSIKVTYTNPDDRLEIEKDDRQIGILKIDVVVELFKQSEKIEYKAAYQYANADVKYAKVIEFPIKNELILQFISKNDGSLAIAARKIED